MIFSEEVTWLNLSTVTEPRSVRGNGLAPPEHCEMHLVLLCARLSLQVTSTPHAHLSQPAERGSGTRWRQGYLLEAPSRVAAALGSGNLFLSPYENLPRHLQMLRLAPPNGPLAQQLVAAGELVLSSLPPTHSKCALWLPLVLLPQGFFSSGGRPLGPGGNTVWKCRKLMTLGQPSTVGDWSPA